MTVFFGYFTQVFTRKIFMSWLKKKKLVRQKAVR